MLKTILLIFAFTLINTSISFAQHNHANVNKSMQRKWIKKTIKELKEKDSMHLLKLTEPNIKSTSKFKYISYRIFGDTRIQCSGGEWIYFTTQSMHKNEKVGDVCLAISEKGKIFVNYGHICGGMIHFENKNDKIPLDADEFFKEFVSDTDDMKWVKWKSN